MRAKQLIEKLIENPDVRARLEALKAEADEIRNKLEAKIVAAGGHAVVADAGFDIYDKDPEYKELVDRLSQGIPNERKELVKVQHRQRQVVGDYIRFGTLPTTRSRNALKAKNDPRRWEAGISVYPAIYDKKSEVWEIDDNEIYASHSGTTDACISDFEDGKTKAYLVKGTELLNKTGSDGEPLLDPRSLKIVKELDSIMWDHEVWGFNYSNEELDDAQKVEVLRGAGYEEDGVRRALIKGGMSEEEADSLMSKVARPA